MKTKLILASLAMVVLMVAAVGVGTLAYFTDTETVKDNTFTTGTIEMCVTTPGGTVVETVEGHILLKPCEVGYLEEYIVNIGNNPIDVWKHTDNVDNEENGVNDPELEFYATHEGSDLWKIKETISTTAQKKACKVR